eukprot:13129030-Alexandrium_andersonii.AAC.1
MATPIVRAQLAARTLLAIHRASHAHLCQPMDKALTATACPRCVAGLPTQRACHVRPARTFL